jgi:hypothetical protein
MQFKSKLILFLAVVALGFTSCTEDEDDVILNIPGNYDGASYTANTTQENTYYADLSDLAAEMKNGRTPNNTVLASSLETIFNKNLTNIVSSEIKTDMGNFFTKIAQSSGKEWNNNTGGTFGGYLFDNYGVEYEQMVEKGLFAAAFYNRASQILNNTTSTADVDKVVALLGAHPDFPNSNNATKHANPDRFGAVYLARRDKNDGSGFYTNTKAGLIKLQAAVKEGDKFPNEKNDAIAQIRKNWEEGLAATAINYLHAMISVATASSVNAADSARLLHSYGEGVAFIYGFKGVNAAERKITNAQIDNYLSILNYPGNANQNAMSFLADRAGNAAKIQQALDLIKSIYGFTDAQVNDFKSNWVSVQDR